VSAIR